MCEGGTAAQQHCASTRVTHAGGLRCKLHAVQQGELHRASCGMRSSGVLGAAQAKRTSTGQQQGARPCYPCGSTRRARELAGGRVGRPAELHGAGCGCPSDENAGGQLSPNGRGSSGAALITVYLGYPQRWIAARTAQTWAPATNVLGDWGAGANGSCPAEGKCAIGQAIWAAGAGARGGACRRFTCIRA